MNQTRRHQRHGGGFHRSRDRLMPEPEASDHPEVLAVEQRQRRLHEANLQVSNPPPVEKDQTVLGQETLVRMVAWEIFAWGPKSHKRLTRELADSLGIPYDRADTLVRAAIQTEEKRRTQAQ